MEIPQGANMILERLEQAGFAAYVVGGCVRDFLLGKVPHDWDVCTSARPEQVQDCFRDFRVLETGIRHGTVTARIKSAMNTTEPLSTETISRFFPS